MIDITLGPLDQDHHCLSFMNNAFGIVMDLLAMRSQFLNTGDLKVYPGIY